MPVLRSGTMHVVLLTHDVPESFDKEGARTLMRTGKVPPVQVWVIQSTAYCLAGTIPSC